MSGKLEDAGTVFGVLVVILVTGWIGVQHLNQTKIERLPIKVKQKLIQFQNKLPISIEEGITLDKFDLNRTLVRLVFRVDTIEKTQFSETQKKEIVTGTQIFICNWRRQVLKDLPTIIEFKILDQQGSKFVELRNTLKGCGSLPPKYREQEKGI